MVQLLGWESALHPWSALLYHTAIINRNGQVNVLELYLSSISWGNSVPRAKLIHATIEHRTTLKQTCKVMDDLVCMPDRIVIDLNAMLLAQKKINLMDKYYTLAVPFCRMRCFSPLTLEQRALKDAHSRLIA